MNRTHVPSRLDQAHALRGLMERFQSGRLEASPPARTARARSVAVTSGKGGVGKTNLAINLAIALARSQARTCLLDANLGLGNVDLLCGLNGYWNLSHVLTGARTLRDIVLDGPGGIDVLPGASGLTDLADCPPAAQADVVRQLEEFEQTHDYVVVDTAAGIHQSVRKFLFACDLILVVTTPEPTAIADAYATIKALSSADGPRLEILVNRCSSAEQARRIAERVRETARTFLRTPVFVGGFIPDDPAVAASVARRRPFLIESPQSPASRSVEGLAARIEREFAVPSAAGPFFQHFEGERDSDWNEYADSADFGGRLICERNPE